MRQWVCVGLIGLACSARAVELHAGSVTVPNQPLALSGPGSFVALATDQQVPAVRTATADDSGVTVMPEPAGSLLMLFGALGIWGAATRGRGETAA